MATRRDFIKASIGAAAGVGALLASPGTALMATIPPPERVEAVKGIFRITGEDAGEAGRFLMFLQQAFPLSSFSWAAQFRSEALIWAPYVASGLSINAYCDEVERFAAFYTGALPSALRI